MLPSSCCAFCSSLMGVIHANLQKFYKENFMIHTPAPAPRTFLRISLRGGDCKKKSPKNAWFCQNFDFLIGVHLTETPLGQHWTYPGESIQQERLYGNMYYIWCQQRKKDKISFKSELCNFLLRCPGWISTCSPNPHAPLNKKIWWTRITALYLLKKVLC